MYALRDYQRQAVDSAVAFMQRRSGYNGVIILPTGAGKSLVIANIAMRLNAPVLVFCPNKEIVEQNYEKVLSYGTAVECGIFSASCQRKEVAQITFATIGSVKANKDYFRRFRFAIIDECHLVNPEEGMYMSFVGVMRCKVLGLTATPYRLYSSIFYGSELRFITNTRKRIFHEVVYVAQIGDLLKRGYLAPIQYYSLHTIDTQRLQINASCTDYAEASVRKAYAEASFGDRLANVVGRLIAVNRKSILVFTRFVEEAEHLARHFGDKAAVVSGTTPKDERGRILADFKAGRIGVVANVGVLTTGFDFPALSTVVLARPTMSLALYYQMVGRAIRPCGDKVAWVVDLCGTYDRFGRVDQLEVTQAKPGVYAVYGGEDKKRLTDVFYKK